MPWKLPGGLANLGEQIDEAAIREVYGNNSVPDPLPEASEIADATWLPLQEYRDMIIMVIENAGDIR